MKNVYVVQRVNFDFDKNRFKESNMFEIEVFSSKKKALEMVYYTIENESLTLKRKEESNSNVVILIDAMTENYDVYRFEIYPKIVNEYDYSV